MNAVSTERRSAAAIGAHVAVGDGRSMALTDGAGTIDWLCWPRFDSEPVFGALLDDLRGGAFRIAPREAIRSVAEYVEDTNVAITTFDAGATQVTLLEAMLVDPDGAGERTFAAEHELVRVIACLRGEAVVDVEIDPRTGWGGRAMKHAIGRDGTVRFRDRGRLLTLRASMRPSFRPRPSGGVACSFTLAAGQRVAFSLTYAEDAPTVLSPIGDGGTALLRATVDTWRAWAARARYAGPYRDAVVRSALLLKLLCYAPSGAIVAAPTTSLPERRGGDMNWDYRYCWLRDAAFTVRALAGLGYEEEANAFVGWMLHATHLTRPELRVLYDVFGRRPAKETEHEGWSGYGGASPVRTGNAAADQLQLDVYGEVVDAVVQSCGVGRPLDVAEKELLREIGMFVVEHWNRPDHGIWEPRGAPRHHVHSRVLCWVALDRLLCLAEQGILALSTSMKDRFGEEREAIASQVRELGWSNALGSYVSTLGGAELDASLLLLSWYGFDEPASPRMRGTFAAVDRELGLGVGLVRRNLEIEDDGGFVACAFWAAEHLARGGGTLADARARFDALLALAPPSGLYAEIARPSGEQLGNFPQGFSHLALVNAALSLARREEAS